MAARLAAIPLEGQNIEDVEAAVVGAFLEFGVEMKRFDSKKSSKAPGARLKLIGLSCKHAMKNRQKEYREGGGGEVSETWTLSSRICCASLSRPGMIVANDNREGKASLTQVPRKRLETYRVGFRPWYSRRVGDPLVVDGGQIVFADVN